MKVWLCNVMDKTNAKVMDKTNFSMLFFDGYKKHFFI